jgi:hypothetical protein
VLAIGQWIANVIGIGLAQPIVPSQDKIIANHVADQRNNPISIDAIPDLINDGLWPIPFLFSLNPDPRHICPPG